jgi:chromosome segregation ATPase
MHTRARFISMLACTSLLACAIPHAARSAEDTTARLREVLHRTQEALRQAQSDNADLTSAKTDTEQKLQAATKALEAARGVSKAEVALRGKLQTTQAAQDDLTQKLKDTTAALAATSLKQGETDKQLALRDAELVQLKQGLELSKTATAGCESKNIKLYSYAQEVLQAYRKKGVWAALSQKDPVFGLKDVDVQNVVQEYQLKMAGEKIQSAAH